MRRPLSLWNPPSSSALIDCCKGLLKRVYASRSFMVEISTTLPRLCVFNHMRLRFRLYQFFFRVFYHGTLRLLLLYVYPLKPITVPTGFLSAAGAPPSFPLVYLSRAASLRSSEDSQSRRRGRLPEPTPGLDSSLRCMTALTYAAVPYRGALKHSSPLCRLLRPNNIEDLLLTHTFFEERVSS